MPFNLKNFSIFLLFFLAWFAIMFFLTDKQKIKASIIEEVESKYSIIKVIEAKDFYFLTFDPIIGGKRPNRQSAHDKKNPLSPVLPYVNVATIAPAYVEKLEKVLTIGFGGGKFPSYIYNYYPQAIFDNVEVDEEVVRIAKKYFAAKETENFKIHIQDGRNFLRNSDGEYDIIFLDAYGPASLPPHLATKEFYELAKQKSSKGGVVVQNISPFDDFVSEIIATMASVFDNFEIYKAQDTSNILLFAYQGEKKDISQLIAKAAKIDAEKKPILKIKSLIKNNYMPDFERKYPYKNANILTDDKPLN